jgi:hypothetical protein
MEASIFMVAAPAGAGTPALAESVMARTLLTAAASSPPPRSFPTVP